MRVEWSENVQTRLCGSKCGLSSGAGAPICAAARFSAARIRQPAHGTVNDVLDPEHDSSFSLKPFSFLLLYPSSLPVGPRASFARTSAVGRCHHHHLRVPSKELSTSQRSRVKTLRACACAARSSWTGAPRTASSSRRPPANGLIFSLSCFSSSIFLEATVAPALLRGNGSSGLLLHFQNYYAVLRWFGFQKGSQIP